MSNNFHLQLYRGTTAQNNAYTGPAGELTVDTQTNNIRLHDGSTAGGVVIGGMPTGSIIPFGGSTAPDGYLLCDGSAVSRSTYSALFAVIGTTYGPGDGNSTFNLPNKSYYTGNIKGNGTTIGFTDGTRTSGIAYLSGSGAVFRGNPPLNVGTDTGDTGGFGTSRLALGISEDITKSGLICDIDSNIKMIIKY